MKGARELVHGTCVALGERAVLLRGESGDGKSDLALRFLALESEGDNAPGLVADDQVWVEARGDGSVVASAPGTLAGRIEVRGVGIMQVPHRKEATLVLVCDLSARESVPRLPPEPLDKTEVAGIPLPCLRLTAFESSAALKLKMALLAAAHDGSYGLH